MLLVAALSNGAFMKLSERHGGTLTPIHQLLIYSRHLIFDFALKDFYEDTSSTKSPCLFPKNLSLDFHKEELGRN